MRVPRWLRGSTEGIRWRSAGGSDAGNVRSFNEDAFLDMPERQLWAVADGMGGHAAGDVASSEVIASLANISASEKLNTASGLVAGAILRANDQLRLMGRERGKDVVIGTTIVAATARANRMAFLWAGDSRGYRLRGSVLTQLTNDHDLLSDMTAKNAPQELIASVMQSNVVARAVGAHDKLEIDEVRVAVQPSDVYLLCSDGLYKEVSEDRIRNILKETDPARSAALLIDAALKSGARDNVTVIVMHAIDGNKRSI